MRILMLPRPPVMPTNHIRAAVLACALSLLAIGADAKLPDGYTPSPDESAWFRAAKQPTGASCCSEETDCRKVPAGQVRVNKDGMYEFHATREIYGANGDNGWHVIPPDKIQHDKHAAENPTGEWVICFMLGLENYPANSGVLCAFEPAGT